ncbi:MAG: hypothetical protein DESF_02583 [Desulfovibrio sp.]
MRVKQPRRQNEEGAYFGCRAICIATEALFEALGLGPMLHRERARASERLRRKAQKMNKKLSDLMGEGWCFRALTPARPSDEPTRPWGIRRDTAQVRNFADDNHGSTEHD